MFTYVRTLIRVIKCYEDRFCGVFLIFPLLLLPFPTLFASRAFHSNGTLARSRYFDTVGAGAPGTRTIHLDLAREPAVFIRVAVKRTLHCGVTFTARVLVERGN
jgi:hypothetical protein